MEQRRVGSGWAAPFFALWTGEALSLVGSQLAQFALVWWLAQTQKAGAATLLATATLVATLPGICLGPFIGALVDRWDRKKTMLVADGAVALAAAALAVLFWQGRVEAWHIFPVLLIRGIGGAFHWPAMLASTSLMVPPEHLPRIQGLNHTLGGVMGILTPPLAALLITVMPLHAVLLIDVVTALVACGILFFVAIPRPVDGAARGDAPPPTVWSDVRAGLGLIWGWPGLRMLMIMAALNNLVFSPVAALLPVLNQKAFGGGPLQLAWLESASGVGIALGGLAIGIGGGFGRPIVTALLGMIGLGAGILVIGLSPRDAFWLALSGVFLANLMLPVLNAPLQAVLQTAVPAGMQGRVFSVMASLSTGIAPLGLILAGPIADLLGIRSWYLMGGAVHLLMGAVGFLLPPVMRLVEDAKKGGSGLWALGSGLEERDDFAAHDSNGRPTRVITSPEPRAQSPELGAERP